MVFFIVLFEAFWVQRSAEDAKVLSVTAVLPPHAFIYVDASAPLQDKDKDLFNRLGGLTIKLQDISFVRNTRFLPPKVEKAVKLHPATAKPTSSRPAYLFTLPLMVLGVPAHHSQISAFQIPATSIMEGIVDLHNDIMIFLTFIIVFVFYLLSVCVIKFSAVDSVSSSSMLDRYGYAGDDVSHNSVIEVI